MWTDFIRPKETVFYTNRTKKLYKSENLINEIDIVNWNNIVEGDKNKVWEVVKIKIKHRVTQLQVKKWNNAKEGKVLRIYKKYWWNDKIVSEIQDPGIHILKKIRIGNSKLNCHWKKERQERVCKMCDKGRVGNQ